MPSVDTPTWSLQQWSGNDHALINVTRNHVFDRGFTPALSAVLTRSLSQIETPDSDLYFGYMPQFVAQARTGIGYSKLWSIALEHTQLIATWVAQLNKDSYHL